MKTIGFGNMPVNPFQTPMTGLGPQRAGFQQGGVSQTGFLGSGLMSSGSFSSGGFSSMRNQSQGVQYPPVRPGFSMGIWQDQMVQNLRFMMDLMGTMMNTMAETMGLSGKQDTQNTGALQLRFHQDGENGQPQSISQIFQIEPSQVQIPQTQEPQSLDDKIAAFSQTFQFPELAPGGGLQAHIANRDLATRQTLFNSLSLIAQDSEGSILLQQAMQRGFTIAVGDPIDPQSKGVSITSGSRTHIIVRDGSDVSTIAHELLHAATPENGNSVNEEGWAAVMGDRIGSRALGVAGQDPNALYTQTTRQYPELQRDNGIQKTLGQLGIQASFMA